VEAFVFGGLGFGLAFFVDAVEVSMEGGGGGGEHEESGAVFEVDHPGGDHIGDHEGEENAADAFFVWGGGGGGDESPEAGVEDGEVEEEAYVSEFGAEADVGGVGSFVDDGHGAFEGFFIKLGPFEVIFSFEKTLSPAFVSDAVSGGGEDFVAVFEGHDAALDGLIAFGLIEFCHSGEEGENGPTEEEAKDDDDDLDGFGATESEGGEESGGAGDEGAF